MHKVTMSEYLANRAKYIEKYRMKEIAAAVAHALAYMEEENKQKNKVVQK